MKIAGMRTTSEATPPAVRYKIGLVQMAMSADPDANLNTAVAKVAEAAAAGARLVCLPELFRSRYFAQHEDAASFDLAEPVPGPSTEALAQAAQRAGVSSSPPCSSGARRGCITTARP